MSIQVTCPNPECARSLRLKDDLAGQKVKCPDCDGLIVVPGGEAKPDALIGKRIAHYEILAKVGQGGMGAVYRARNVRLSKIVALKILPPALMAKDPSFVERFIREAQSTAQLEHPNVVTVHFVGSDAGRHFIEMQYVDGQTLAEILRDPENLSPSQATRIIADAARALEAAHAKGIVHRDIKPENIMLTVDGQVKVADFGLASLGTAGESVMSGGKVLGTPYYMSPEHCRGDATDARSDIYSLGATYYHALVGKPPFFGASLADVARMQVTAPLPPPKALVPALPDAVNDVVMTMMAKRAEERYPSCSELLSGLDEAARALAPPESIDAHLDDVEQVGGRSALARIAVVLLVMGLVAAGTLAGAYFAPWRTGSKEEKTPVSAPPTPKAPEPTPRVDVPAVPVDTAPPAAPSPDTTLPPTPAEPTVQPAAPPDELARAQPEPPGTPAIPTVSLLPPDGPSGQNTAPTEPEPDEKKAPPRSEVDLQEYVDAVAPIDELIDERRYASAAVKTNVLAAKVKHAEGHAKQKRENIDRIRTAWEKIQEAVNSGRQSLPMKNISKRYGYAGTLVHVDATGLVGETAKKARVVVKWDRLPKEDVLNLWAAVRGTKDADGALALAAFCMEGSHKLLDKAEVFLGAAAEHGVDIKPLVREIKFLREASLFQPTPAVEKQPDEPAKKEAEESKEKPDKGSEKEPDKPKEKVVRGYRKRLRHGMRYPLDSRSQVQQQNLFAPRWMRFAKGKKGGAVVLGQDPFGVPANLPKEEGALDFWLRVSGPDRPAFGLVWAVAPAHERRVGTMYPVVVRVYKGLQVTFSRPLGKPPDSVVLTTKAEIEQDEWTHLAIEWGEGGYRVYVNGELDGHTNDPTGLFADVQSIGFYRWLETGAGGIPPETKMKVLVDEVNLYYPKKRKR